MGFEDFFMGSNDAGSVLSFSPLNNIVLTLLWEDSPSTLATRSYRFIFYIVKLTNSRLSENNILLQNT